MSSDNISETRSDYTCKNKDDFYCKNECKAKLRFMINKDKNTLYKLTSELKDMNHCHFPIDVSMNL